VKFHLNAAISLGAMLKKVQKAAFIQHFAAF
jgi:hypothetical protein